MPGKWTRRGVAALWNTLRYFTVPAGSFVIAYLVKDKESIEAWGEFVEFLVVISVLQIISLWGMKEYLLKAFSLTPASIGPLYTAHLLARIPVLSVCCFFLITFYPFPVTGWLMIWLGGAFLSQATEALTVYHKNLRSFAVLEFLIIAGVMLWIFFLPEISTAQLAYIFAIQYAVKGLASFLFYIRHIAAPETPFTIGNITNSTWFFLLGLSGMLFSRADLFVVLWKLPDSVTGNYQVLLSLLIYSQALAGFMVMPFQKNIYRMHPASVQKTSILFFLVGLGITLFAVPGIMLFMDLLFDFAFTPWLLILCALYILPAFYALPVIHYFYAEHKEKWVLMVNIAGAAVNTSLSLWLVESMEITGALTAAAASQLLMMIAYIFLFMKSRSLANT